MRTAPRSDPADCLLGIDVGSSSVKACLVDADTRRRLGRSQSPAGEMPIDAPHPGFAEQDPECWWQHVCSATQHLLQQTATNPARVRAIGISYQMHGLVLIDEDRAVVRPAIIWCDGRAVSSGQGLLELAGAERCAQHLLNAPGNFTAAKLAWVREHEPEIFGRARTMLLPGDWVAMRMTDRVAITAPGLSEATLWDFPANRPAEFLLAAAGIDPDILPEVVPTFSEQGRLSVAAAEALGLQPDTPITYRAGDQPNNAFALEVLEPGQVAATAGTSGVVYGVSARATYDPEQRVNTFAHVTHEPGTERYGTLLCVNGTGALNAWLRREVAGTDVHYEVMNTAAAEVSVGSDGLTVLPFGNGAERMLGNRDIGAHFVGLELQRHGRAHLWRAAQEGIACALAHGMAILSDLGLDLTRIRAGNSNMFLSPVFREALAGLTGTAIDLYDTEGAQGAALAAGVGLGLYATPADAFGGIEPLFTVEPDDRNRSAYAHLNERWQAALSRALQ
jgi:xylulokinase